MSNILKDLIKKALKEAEIAGQSRTGSGCPKKWQCKKDGECAKFHDMECGHYECVSGCCHKMCDDGERGGPGVEDPRPQEPKRDRKPTTAVDEDKNITISQADGDEICQMHGYDSMVPNSLDCSSTPCTITCATGNTTQTVAYKTSKKPMKKGIKEYIEEGDSCNHYCYCGGGAGPTVPGIVKNGYCEPLKPCPCEGSGKKAKNQIKKYKSDKGEKIKEAELSADNTKFSIKVDVSNKQSETKLGIRIQLTPKGGMLEPDVRDKLEAAIMKKLNNSLEKFDIQVSKDTDVPNPEVLGFFIPLSQIKNMIVTSIKGPEGVGTTQMPTSPTPVPPQQSPKPPSSMTEPIDEMVNRMIDEELIVEMRQRTLNEISKIVVKEDFYSFINKGNNILRSCEDAGIPDGKKYLIYLVKHNIM
jgi:hypothetical protein